MKIFDLTKEIALENALLQKKYDTARIILHLVFLVVMFFVAYRILFPIVPLDFSLDTPNSTKNTLTSVRISQTGEFPNKKMLDTNDVLLFNANPIGQFSKANIKFTLAKNTNDIEGTSVGIRKSYQAFFYPTGSPADFKNGTLVTTPNGSYYLVSDGLLRKFSNTDVILKMGYPKSAFIEISFDDLKLNKAGENITDTENYPNDSIFIIDENYYQLKNQQLFPFVSTRAFLSQFDGVSAIAKSTDFLSRYPISETYLGFANGTLASSAESAFILSDGKSYPIENEVTFMAMGFDWNSVVALNSNELGIYKKQKQFTNNAPHPDGTIFVDQKTNTYFIIKNGEKHPMNSDVLIKTYSKQKPIIADSQESEKEASCVLKKNTFSSNNYECSVSLIDLTSLTGNDYQLESTFPKSVVLNNINVTFSTPMTFQSLRNSLSVIKNKLKNRQQ